MTVKELYEYTKSPMEIKSGYNGKLLCKRYVAKKHTDISDRQVSSVWTEIRVSNSGGYSSMAIPIVCVYVTGEKEYIDTHKEVSP